MVKPSITIPSILLLLLLLSVSQPGVSEETGSSGSDQEPVKALSRTSGYVLLEVHADHAGASLAFGGYGSRLMGRNQFQMKFEDGETGYRLLAVPKGVYQVSEVTAPYYDLPFRLDVQDEPAWRFSVKAGHVNYIGSLFIEGDRSKTDVDIRFLNRLAMNVDEISAQFERVLSHYPLVSGAVYRDPFLEKLKELPGE